MAVDKPKEPDKGAKKEAGEKSPAKGKKHGKPRPMPDVARMYMDDQAEAKTPMVFVTRDGDLHATVMESGKYRHLLCVEGEPTEAEKLALEYHYKQVDADTVAEKVGHDASVDTKGLPASLLYHKDFRLSNRELWVSRKEHIPVRFTMRGSAQFTGLIEWFTPHAVKLNIGLRGKDVHEFTALRACCAFLISK